MDNIYKQYNRTDMEIESGILTTDLSDHLPCIYTLKFEKAVHKTKKELEFQHRKIYKQLCHLQTRSPRPYSAVSSYFAFAQIRFDLCVVSGRKFDDK